MLKGNFLTIGLGKNSGATVLGGINAAMVGSVFSVLFWENVTFVSGEIENPQKNVVKANGFGYNFCDGFLFVGGISFI